MVTYVWPNILDCNCMYRGWSNYYLLLTHTHTHAPKAWISPQFQLSEIESHETVSPPVSPATNASIFFKPTPGDLQTPQNKSPGCCHTELLRGSAWYLYLSDPFVPHFAHIVGARSGEAGGWQLAFKNANPTTLKGPDNSWGPHQFVYSSVIRSRHLDCAPAEHRQPCRVERGARCDRGPRRGE